VYIEIKGTVEIEKVQQERKERPEQDFALWLARVMEDSGKYKFSGTITLRKENQE
jgi:hypothetical protein